jgi:enoyl-CoA hydratase/carnithine racemase
MAHVTHHVQSHVATITLSNPGRYNAMSLAMWAQLADTLDLLSHDGEVRAVILRGDGDKAFVSGADISEFETQRNDPANVAAYDAAVDRAQTALAQFPRPVIAAISGICYGGGLGLAMACDMRYAAPNARFRMPAARLGLGYALKGMKRLVDVLGVARASEVFYTARVLDAAAAERFGVVNSVHDDVFAHAAQTGAEIASNAPMTIATAKRAFTTLLAGSLDADVKAVDAQVKACFASSDYAEGRKAFAEKRVPNFTGL